MRWLAAALLVLCGCAHRSERVVVVDSAGNPVAGALVTPLAPSINGPFAVTDAAGIAQVDLSSHGQAPEWITVSMAGFDPVSTRIQCDGRGHRSKARTWPGCSTVRWALHLLTMELDSQALPRSRRAQRPAVAVATTGDQGNLAPRGGSSASARSVSRPSSR